MRPRNVLMLKPGEAAEPIRLEVGDYDRWFQGALGGGPYRFHVVRPYLGEALPRNVRDHDAVIVTGSPLSATAPTAWMKELAGYMVDAAERRVPVLGVCFGHQLLGMVMGVPVVKSPAGREIGTVEVALTEEGWRDPLFEGLPARFPIQTTHEDVVPVLPPGARLLAKNEAAAVQAMALGKYLRGVQFHPELSAEGVKSVIRSREAAIDREGQARGEKHRARRLLDGVRPAPYGRQILENFLTRF
ncbi:MAG TPA: glutamine amidotransferase [Myxococcales bacterium]|nr:glutamine amidotransferase [Myxococcales bacterium]